MSLTQDQLKAMTFQRPSMIPIEVGVLPATWKKYRDNLNAIFLRYPELFPNHRTPDYDNVPMPDTYHLGDHVDEWGCVWSNVQDGMEAIVTQHPVPTREAVLTLKAPAEIKPQLKHGFMYLRLADLRGFEEVMIDFAEDAPELQMLIDIVLEHNMQRLELMNRTLPADEIYWFGDDLGIQTGLAMGAEKWRQYLKPCFMRVYSYWRSTGRPVYFHTDGCIWEIIGDLAECGVQVINPQFRANGIDNLVRVCRGKICADLDLDRQMFPFCSPKDLDEHVRESVMKLGSREGGLWLKAEIAPDVPLENVDALLAAMQKYRTYWS